MVNEVFESQLAYKMLNNQSERTFIDKLLAKEDIARIKDLTTKEQLNRSELLELMYLCLGAESKLMSITARERYLLSKFFVWIREFIKAAEFHFDYKDKVKIMKHEKESEYIVELRAFIEAQKALSELKGKYEDGRDKVGINKNLVKYLSKTDSLITDRTQLYLENSERMLEHDAKFMIDVFFMITRTSSSINAMAFIELLKNKYEVNYQQQNNVNTPQPEKGQKLTG
jgi:hypothetical protein